MGSVYAFEAYVWNELSVQCNLANKHDDFMEGKCSTFKRDVHNSNGTFEVRLQSLLEDISYAKKGNLIGSHTYIYQWLFQIKKDVIYIFIFLIFYIYNIFLFNK